MFCFEVMVGGSVVWNVGSARDGNFFVMEIKDFKIKVRSLIG
jgi:Icc-related predicted phosphoesterase